MPSDCSVSWCRDSTPSSSKRHTHTAVALGAWTAKFVDSGDQEAPRGWCRPGQTDARSPRLQPQTGGHRWHCSRCRHPCEAGVAAQCGADCATAQARRWHMSEFVRLEVQDGVGTIRLDRPKMNALNVQVQEEIRAAATEAAEREDVRAVVVYGGERVFAAGADIKEMADMSYQDMVRRSGGAAVVVHVGGEDPEAGRRGGDRLRPRRRVRARAVRRLPDRGRRRDARPARDPARRHARRGRHPAAHAGWSARARRRT